MICERIPSMTTKYQEWYDSIICRAQGRHLDVYFERHHILPRSLGGGDEETNLVDLTYREHFLVHWLLTKIYDGAAKCPMVFALHCMTFGVSGRLVAGWQIEVAKRLLKDESIKRSEQLKKLRLEFKLRKRDEAIAAAEESEKIAPSMSHVDDRYRLGGMANSWLACYGTLKRKRKGSIAKLPPSLYQGRPKKRKPVRSKAERRAQSAKKTI
jgi:hypothetical protein